MGIQKALNSLIQLQEKALMIIFVHKYLSYSLNLSLISIKAFSITSLISLPIFEWCAT